MLHSHAVILAGYKEKNKGIVVPSKDTNDLNDKEQNYLWQNKNYIYIYSLDAQIIFRIFLVTFECKEM